MSTRARPLNDVIRDLNEFLLGYPGKQSKLAKDAGVNQSTISRALHSKGRSRHSGGLVKLCIFANIPLTLSHEAPLPDPSTSPELMEALAQVWDGSPNHAKAIARIIRDLQHISMHRNHP